MGVPLVHNFHTQTSPIKDIGPSRNHAILTINQRLVEVETVEVKRHCAYAQRSKPNSNHWPCCQEEVQRA